MLQSVLHVWSTTEMPHWLMGYTGEVRKRRRSGCADEGRRSSQRMAEGQEVEEEEHAQEEGPQVVVLPDRREKDGERDRERERERVLL